MNPAAHAGEPPRLAAVDGLRGIAILAVLLLHFLLLTPEGPVARPTALLLDTGWVGVDLFFVLSGFLITGILWDARGSAGYFWRFYARRTLRIFPLYYAYLAAVLVALPLLLPQYAAEHAGTDRRWWLWSYLGNVLMAREGWAGMPSHTTHLWSLAVEEQFYLIWPVVVLLLGRRALLGTCAGILLLSPLIRVALREAYPDGIASYTLLPARLDGLACGALLALAVREPATAELARRWSGRVLAAALAALAALAAWGRTREWPSLLPPLDPAVQAVGYSLIAVAGGALLVRAIGTSPEAPFGRVLASRPLQSFGKYSYALYLLHIPLRNVLRDRIVASGGLPRLGGSQLPAQLALYALGIGATWLLAYASWHLFEQHWLRLKRFVPYGAPREAPAAIRAAA